MCPASYLQPQPQNPVEFRKSAIQKYSRNAVVWVDSGVVDGAVLGLLAGSMSLFLILAVAGPVGDFLNWQKVQWVMSYKDPQ